MYEVKEVVPSWMGCSAVGPGEARKRYLRRGNAPTQPNLHACRAGPGASYSGRFTGPRRVGMRCINTHILGSAPVLSRWDDGCWKSSASLSLSLARSLARCLCSPEFCRSPARMEGCYYLGRQVLSEPVSGAHVNSPRATGGASSAPWSALWSFVVTAGDDGNHED